MLPHICITINMLVVYGVSSQVIFAAATSDSNPYYSTIWVVLARLLGFFLSAWLIERIGRVRLLQASAGVQLLGSVLVGFFFYYRPSLAAHGWLVLVGALIIFFTYGVGIAPVTWVYFSELTASAVRSVSLNILLVCFGLMMFSFVHSYVWLESVLGIHGVFWALSVLSVVQIVFAQIWLPETRGLTLEQIQSRYFEGAQDESDSESEKAHEMQRDPAQQNAV
ncbi:facilitated trehalose transporter Tret1-2 homolog [Amphibalanus amphitrite]|uniref:facilitated trehalose transporter Tret1-2 homolog n=1 Tax=Amphibalanus amphitrite TaxID=1232801 RepID=UPI001C921559|nr:facilitated trehalose transporter Tret1-2 homolog [Amphibalanus amphitrite]